MVEKMVQAAVVLDIHYTFLKQFNNAMIIFSTNKKNAEKKKRKTIDFTKNPLSRKFIKNRQLLKVTK